MMNFEEGLSLPYLGHKTKIRLLENLITLSEILKKVKTKNQHHVIIASSTLIFQNWQVYSTELKFHSQEFIKPQTNQQIQATTIMACQNLWIWCCRSCTTIWDPNAWMEQLKLGSRKEGCCSEVSIFRRVCEVRWPSFFIWVTLPTFDETNLC